MKPRTPPLTLCLVGALLAPNLSAQDEGVIKDMTVVRLIGINFYGEEAGHYAYSFGTTSCNEGNVPLAWIASAGGRVNIAQNIFRVHDGRVEQLGYSWLKLGFCAINESLCGTCEGTPCTTLGVGCADTYSAGLNDGVFGHGKADVDPTTGEHVQAMTSPSGDGLLTGRLRVRADELAQPEAVYFAEVQYVCEEDAKFGMARNNNSWRLLGTTPGSGDVSFSGGVQKYECAVDAWRSLEPSVTVVEVVNGQEPTAVDGARGHYVLGYSVTELAGELWRYEYAVQNLTSDQGAGSFTIPVPCAGVEVSDIFFRDVEHHSGSPYDNIDWDFSAGGGTLRWRVTQGFAENPRANAIHWGELFNFGFTANAPPSASQASIGLFKPGLATCLVAPIEGPCRSGPCGATTYCTGAPNSYSAAGASIGHGGRTSLCANDLELRVENATPHETGVFFYGPETLSAAFGNGTLCVGGGSLGTFRLNPPVVSNASGTASLAVDYATLSDTGEITPGTTWSFQYWYRDPAAGGAFFNLSNGLTATFCP